MFPAEWARRHAGERLGIEPDEIDGGPLGHTEPSPHARRSTRGLRSRHSVRRSVRQRVTHRLASQFAAPHVAGAIAKIQQALDRSGSQLRYASSKTRSACWPLAFTTHTRKRRAGVARLGDFYAVVVGSGFSGAVAAARLAPAGFAILERGRRRPGDRSPGQYSRPDGCGRPRGLFDIRWLDRMLSVQGPGWGGGSLIYANVFALPLRVYDLVGNVPVSC
jgi:hypothetical protein